MPHAPKSVHRKKGQVYIANESFVAKDVNGLDKQFHQGRTRVVEGDEILDRCGHYFDLLEDNDASDSYE